MPNSLENPASTQFRTDFFLCVCSTPLGEQMRAILWSQMTMRNPPNPNYCRSPNCFGNKVDTAMKFLAELDKKEIFVSWIHIGHFPKQELSGIAEYLNYQNL